MEFSPKTGANMKATARGDSTQIAAVGGQG
jgi:hypothetical protein